MNDDTLNVITSNRGKYVEYKEKLKGHHREIEMVNIYYPEIQTDSLEAVVKFALKELEDHAPLIIDDSGIFIDALDGFPGVYSAYVMKTLGCEGILSLMEDQDDRSSRFECVIGYLDEEKKLFKGISKGSITYEKKGTKGFGYDPIFRQDGFEKTYAEMTSEEKNRISHRGRAMDKLLDHVKESY